VGPGAGANGDAGFSPAQLNNKIAKQHHSPIIAKWRLITTPSCGQ
jgi:hypothetical protein